MGTNWMFFGALFGSLFLYIQAGTILMTKEVAGLSFPAFALTFASSVVWLFYGIETKELIIKTSAVANLLGSFLILALILAYSGNIKNESTDLKQYIDEMKDDKVYLMINEPDEIMSFEEEKENDIETM